MQQTVFFKKDKKTVHVVAMETDRFTRCGIPVKKGEDEVWNEKGLTCPVCLGKVEEEISLSFRLFAKCNPGVLE